MIPVYAKVVPALPTLLGRATPCPAEETQTEEEAPRSAWCQEIDKRWDYFLPGVRAGSRTLGMTGFEPSAESMAELLTPKEFRDVFRLRTKLRRFDKMEKRYKERLCVYKSLCYRPTKFCPIAAHYELKIQQAVQIHIPIPQRPPQAFGP
ncbi:unnamed protein product [Symbiodinium pilosum]|uniref:Uncharacterized protein n=1 Tax=Symbiodinium pilosum TaxID=2952 RepID=A0A812TXR9_SYMPI|nr:unnamed protein product [Symbiodinium pilosum]